LACYFVKIEHPFLSTGVIFFLPKNTVPSPEVNRIPNVINKANCRAGLDAAAIEEAHGRAEK
jgi:hypothetical protein